MKVQSLLAQKGNRVATIGPDEKIQAAARRLKEEGVGALVVSEDGGTVAGILSERDIVRAMVDHSDGLARMRVSDLMTQDVKTCSPDDRIHEVMAQMTQSRFRHLPVVQGGKLCGIISIGDVVKNRLEELEAEASVLKDYIGGRA